MKIFIKLICAVLLLTGCSSKHMNSNKTTTENDNKTETTSISDYLHGFWKAKGPAATYYVYFENDENDEYYKWCDAANGKHYATSDGEGTYTYKKGTLKILNTDINGQLTKKSSSKFTCANGTYSYVFTKVNQSEYSKNKKIRLSDMIGSKDNSIQQNTTASESRSSLNNENEETLRRSQAAADEATRESQKANEEAMKQSQAAADDSARESQRAAEEARQMAEQEANNANNMTMGMGV